MVSLASILGSILIVLLSLFLKDPIFTAFLAIIACLLIYRHRSNISRIKNGNESLVPFGLVYHLKKN